MTKTLASLSFFLVTTLTMLGLHASQPLGPAVFIFGDSGLDVGTNNFIPETRSKANVPLNGIDYRGPAPTGRYSNGYNIADKLVHLMDMAESPPPFLYVLYDDICYLKTVENFRGVNFASGGSGVLNTTGIIRFKKVVPIGEQIQQFATVRSNLSEVLGGNVSTMIGSSFFLINTGSNDILENFIINQTHSCAQDFMTSLMGNYSTHLKNLLDLGAVKFGIMSVLPLGCCPHQRSLNESGGCMEAMNACAQLFYSELEGLLQNLSLEYPAMKYSLANSYELVHGVIDGSIPSPFKEQQKACCGKGKFNGESRCVPSANLCPNRNEYLFWDVFHPTESASQLAATFLFLGKPPFLTPINFGQLYTLDN